MPVLKGTIMSLFDYKLPKNCTVVLCIYDVTNLSQLLLHRTEIQNPDVTFPIPYEVEYPEPDYPDGKGTLFHMSVRIFHDKEILYTNNCNDMIGKNMKFRKHLDVFLYYVPFFKSIKEE